MLRRVFWVGSLSRRATGRRRRKFKDGNDSPVPLCGEPPCRAAPLCPGRSAAGPGRGAAAGRAQGSSRVHSWRCKRP